MDDKEKHFISELLDASLRNYAGGEPRAGLEGRVLAGVRARQQAARRRMAWLWVAGITGVVAMVTLLAVSLTHRQPAPMPTIAKAPANPPAAVVAKGAPAVQPPVARRSPRHTAPAAVEWRPQQFPTPRPLSEQEKLLVAYVQALKGSAAAATPSAKQDVEPGLAIPPLSITALKIEPLAPNEDGDGK